MCYVCVILPSEGSQKKIDNNKVKTIVIVGHPLLPVKPLTSDKSQRGGGVSGPPPSGSALGELNGD